MSYVRKILQPDEQIVYRAPIHWIVYWPFLVFLVLAALMFGWFLMLPQPADNPFLSGAILVVGGLLLAAGLFMFLHALIERHSTELVITTRRVVAKIGFVQRRTWEINAAKVEGVEVVQSVFGRIFDYGTVTVKGTGGGTAPIRNIDDPVAFRAKITSL